MNEPRADLPRTTLGVLFIGVLVLSSFWILRPFLGAFIWAVMIVVATWPLLLGLQQRLRGRRGLATTIMTLAVLLVFVVPFIGAISLIAERTDDVVAFARNLAEKPLPPLPAWLTDLPLVGRRIADVWQGLASSGAADLVQRLEPYAQDVTRWLVAEAATIGLLFVQGLLIAILSAVLYSKGEGWGGWVMAFGRRLAGEQGGNAVVLAGSAIRAVALGVVLTALIQAALSGIGLAFAGVPFPLALTALIFVLCIAQIGPLLVMVAATAWLFSNGESGWGSVMVVWTIVVSILDNILRPLLIKRGADLPLLLIFAGVIGGLLSFGVIGLFIGPVVLAVTYTLVDAWVAGRPGEQAAASGDEG
ncbi:MAG: AI-2E family transporter YdiK [Gammaproteobacteria bacterium]|nr:AI-2E family transporter YdiK [Gammaproteobacteria bacterium]